MERHHHCFHYFGNRLPHFLIPGLCYWSNLSRSLSYNTNQNLHKIGVPNASHGEIYFIRRLKIVIQDKLGGLLYVSFSLPFTAANVSFSIKVCLVFNNEYNKCLYLYKHWYICLDISALPIIIMCHNWAQLDYTFAHDRQESEYLTKKWSWL